MGGNDYRHLLISFALFGLFLILIITPIVLISENYGVESSKLDDATGGALNIDAYESDITGDDGSSVDEDWENYRERFESGSVDDVDDPSGIFSVLGDGVFSILTPFQLLAQIGKNVLGIPVVVTYVLLGIINLFLILAIWRVIRQGD